MIKYYLILFLTPLFGIVIRIPTMATTTIKILNNNAIPAAYLTFILFVLPMKISAISEMPFMLLSP